MWPFSRKQPDREDLDDEPVDIPVVTEESSKYICVQCKADHGLSIFDIEELEHKFAADFVQAEFCHTLRCLTVFMRKKD